MKFHEIFDFIYDFMKFHEIWFRQGSFVFDCELNPVFSSVKQFVITRERYASGP
jgi:hypothetical protein